MKPHVEALCDKLVANHPRFTELDLSLILFNDDDEDLELVFEAARKNHTLEKMTISGNAHGVALSVRAAWSLAFAVSTHPKMKELYFFNIEIKDFGAIALAIRQNEILTHLRLDSCTHLTTDLMENIRCLLSANLLESLSVINCECAENQPLDLSGALRSNRSLKRLVLRNGENETMVVSPETIHDISILLSANNVIDSLELSKIDLMSSLVLLIARAVEGHESLTKLVLQYPRKQCCSSDW